MTKPNTIETHADTKHTVIPPLIQFIPKQSFDPGIVIWESYRAPYISWIPNPSSAAISMAIPQFRPKFPTKKTSFITVGARDHTIPMPVPANTVANIKKNILSARDNATIWLARKQIHPTIKIQRRGSFALKWSEISPVARLTTALVIGIISVKRSSYTLRHVVVLLRVVLLSKTAEAFSIVSYSVVHSDLLMVVILLT